MTTVGTPPQWDGFSPGHRARLAGVFPAPEEILRTGHADMPVGTPVTYRDINLQAYRGTIIALGTQPRGGDCLVQWHKPLEVRAEQCTCNLPGLKPNDEGRT